MHQCSVSLAVYLSVMATPVFAFELPNLPDIASQKVLQVFQWDNTKTTGLFVSDLVSNVLTQAA